MGTQHGLGDGAAPAGGDVVQNRLIGEADPVPVQVAVDAGGG
jgi:hypothetical protein